MKNYYFSLILFLTVCISSVYVNFLTTNEINRYISFFNYFSQVTDISDTDKNRITDLKYRFESKKNMLRLIISKEHIHNIETNILLIENYMDDKSTDEIQSTSIESVAILNQIKEYLVAVN